MAEKILFKDPPGQAPLIRVGILRSPEVRITLHGAFRLLINRELPSIREASPEAGSSESFSGSFHIKPSENTIRLFKGEDLVSEGDASAQWRMEPLSPQSLFELQDVSIGIDFHWERKENQLFSGCLSWLTDGDQIQVINELPLEDYLVSVISSEMNATASEAFLKAHAIISRSWLLAQMQSKGKKPAADPVQTDRGHEHIRWYDREDHLLFDVCADDHCQRYQGIGRASTDAVRQAVEETAGLVLTHGNEICDARYSKCCGGITEAFENVWEPRPHAYLQSFFDHPDKPDTFEQLPRNEDEASRWIMANHEAFCHTTDKHILSQVLNDYDQETPDFYRWQKRLGQDELQELIHRKTGLDTGAIMALEPIERGPSGRLIRLGIKGTRGYFIIGKELEIRKAFSPSHLYSAAFVSLPLGPSHGLPGGFMLRGAGWGHGAGLCQIGAAVMGSRGYSHQQILAHYFRGSSLDKLY